MGLKLFPEVNFSDPLCTMVIRQNKIQNKKKKKRSFFFFKSKGDKLDVNRPRGLAQIGLLTG